MVILLISLTLAFLLSAGFRRLKLPRVVAQTTAGLVLGLPAIKPLLFDAQNLSFLQLLANIGLILLFFFVGLETNLAAFTKNVKESALISLFNTSIPLILGYAASHYIFGLSPVPSMIIGISLAVSSQSISIDFLEELKLFKSRIGQLIISAGVVDDIFELILVSGILIFITITASQAAFLTVLFNIVAFIGALFIVRFVAIPLILTISEKDSKHLLFMSSVVLVLLTASLADLFKVGAVMGSLFAGILLRQTMLASRKRAWEEHQIAQTFHIISFGFFVPLFFIWIGLNASIMEIFGNLPMTAAFILIAFAGTITGTMIGARLSGHSTMEGYLVGWGVNAKGDTELVIATLALGAGVITLGIFSSLIAMSMATTLVSPIIFKALVKRKHGKTSG